ncbi:MAG: hypothetical protein ABL929_03465 [Ferruginibacter sp.]|nr:hypothetical protein [Ferruginibacter sp.]
MKKVTLILQCIFIVATMSNCKKTKPDAGSGSAVFYTTSNVHGTIQITISGGPQNPTSFNVPVTTNPDSYCTNGWTGYVLLNAETTYTYNATAADGSRWSGTIDITKGFCIQRKLQ